MQVGGALLGKGKFGCTFEPVPKCASGRTFKQIHGASTVGKITTDDPTDELRAGKAIMALPSASQYFALPTTGCRPQIPVQDPDAKSCRMLEEADTGAKFAMLVMPTAGQQLYKYSLNLARLAKIYRSMFVHLLEGGVLYQSIGYVHNDIHMGNVLVDDKGVARFIDFGIAFRINDIHVWEDSNMGTTFRPNYSWQAPEVHAWRMMLNHIRLEDGVAQIKEVNSDYASLEHQFPTRKTALAALTDFMRTSQFVIQKDGGGFLRAYGKRFDSWRIGLCMWYLWSDLLKWTPFLQTPLYGERDLIRRVMGGLTDFDPRTRFSLEDALRLLDPSVT